MLDQGTLTEVDGLSTVDLLIKVACFVKKSKIYILRDESG
jgi:hypothetical protein